jgi:Tfp pilus assembly protein PilX
MLNRLRDERGIALVSALLISMVLVSISIAVVALSIHNVTQSSNDRKRLQAINTAEAGMGTTESLLQTTSTANLPCSDTTPPDPRLHATLPTTPSSEYTATINYYASYPPAGSPMTCSQVQAGSSLPAAAQIISSGTAVIRGQAAAVTRTMETLVALHPLRAGFNQAIFSDSGLDLENNLTVLGNVGNDGDIYTNGNFTCANSSTINGSTLVQGRADLSSSCRIIQDLWTKGSITMSNSSEVDHDATASTKNPDNTTATISMANTSKVVHNARSAGACTGCAGRVLGSITPNSVANNPPRIDLPKVNYVQSCWANPASCDADIPIAAYSNFVTFNNCSTSGAGNTQDTIDTGWASNTVARITSNCVLSWQNNTTVNVRGNLAIITDGGLSTLNKTTFQAPVGETHDLYLIVPWEATTGGNLTGGTPNCTLGAHDISIANNSDFVRVHVFMYTPCKVTYNNNNAGLGGQVLAGTVDVQNLYNLQFSPLRVPGAGQIVGYRVDIAYEREIVNPTP